MTRPHDALDLAREPGLIAALPAPVFVVRAGQFLYVNPAFAELMGLEPGDLVGHDSLQRVHPDDRHLLRQPPSEPGGAGDSSAAQVRVKRGDGAERSLIITTRPIATANGAAVVGTAADITLQPDVLNLSVRMAALGRLAGGVAHDFNNLLLVIGGQLERLQQDLPPGRDVQRVVEAISTAARRAALLTDQLLSFGRRQMLSPQVMDLSAFIQEMEPQLRSRVGAAVDLIVSSQAGLPPIRADHARLREVLWHLVDNARDAMPHGGTLSLTADTITIDAELEARWAFLTRGGVFVRLRVTDSGAGMDPAVTPHVFEPFFTTKGRGRGAGMGLASVYGIVKQSAGYVFVDETGAAGTCITILLPPAVSPERTAPGPQAAARAPSGRPRLLLVEDDDAVRELLGEVLTHQGFDVTTAETAEDGERRAADTAFDLLLSDIDLPGKSGAQLAAALCARQPALRVVLMSGYPDDGAIAEAGLTRPPVVLRKPFATTALVAQIRAMLAASPESNAQ